MKNIFFIIWLSCLSSCTNLPPIQLLGEISTDDSGFFLIKDCKSQQTFKLDVMASNPYFLLSKTYENLKAKGTVMASVRGQLARHHLVQDPLITDIHIGRCD